MKNLFIASSLLIAFTGLANAFETRTQCQFNAFHGECTAVNDSNFVIRCQLHIEGRTRSGATSNAQEDVFLYPGQNAYAYVNANNGYVDPLVYVNGYANCQF